MAPPRRQQSPQRERPFSPTRLPSSPSTSADGSGSSDLHLPPNTASEELYLSGEVPNVLADRALGLHSPRLDHDRLAPTRPSYFGGERSRSLMSVLTGGRSRSREASIKGKEPEDEAARPLLDDVDDNNDDVTGNGEAEEGETTPAGRRRRDRSESTVRKTKWYRRASPYWFLPGTMIMALSMGMIISPKMEIYSQLICRALTPASDLPTPAGSILSQFTFASSSAYSSSLQTESWNGIGGQDVGDLDWAKKCRSKPEVQKTVTSLATALALSSGLLAALTTGYWGALSDRRGRKPVLALSLFGMLFMDVIFLFVVTYHNVVGYRFLLLGPAVDGMLGGYATAMAAMNAYLSDCTDPGSRAQIFSILGGLLFGGIALGPTLGSLLVKSSTSPNAILRPFYAALAMHALYFLSIVFIIPESLSKARQMKARERWAEEKASRGGWRPWSFLRPLALLLPKGKDSELVGEDVPILWSRAADGGRDVGEKELRARRWALTEVAIAYSLYILVLSVVTVKILYAQYKFSWDAATNGYFLSFTGASRMLVLVVVLPGMIRLFRKPSPLPAWSKPTVPEDGSEPSDEVAGQIEKWDREAKYLRVVHDSHFDLFLARLSILIDFVSYAIIAFPGVTPASYVVASFIQGFGGGANPALQSLALAHASPRDSGRLFASLSVLSALCSSVIGPTMFGVVYFASLQTWPEAIFFIASAAYLLSFFVLLLIRLGDKPDAAAAAVRGRDEGPKDSASVESGTRGRSETRRET